MNIYAIHSLFGAIASLVLGIFVYSKNSKKSLNRTFAVFCISVFILSFAEFGMRQAESQETAKFWFNLTGILPLCAFSLFHFTLVFYNEDIFKKKKWISPMIYITTSVLTFIEFIYTIFYANPIKTSWGYDYYLSQDILASFIINMILFLSLLVTILSIFLFIKIYVFSPNELKRMQAKLISIGLISIISTFIIINFLIPLIDPANGYPDFTMLILTLVCIIIGYAMWKYELFSLDLTTASEKIFSSISDCLILTDHKGGILSVNQVLLNLLNYQEKEVKNKPFTFLLASEEDFKLFQYQSQLLTKIENGEFLTDIEVAFKTKENIKIKVSLTASKIYDKNRKLQGIIYIGRNITKTKKIEQQLKDAIEKSQFKSKFLSSMSHELRTPLNAIMGFVELLLEDYCGPLNKCQNEFLSDVKFSSNELLELINRLLDLSKIEAGELVLEIKGVNFETLLRHIQTILKPLCRKKHIDFQIENLVSSEFIYADFVRLKEILFNLLNNAIKFTLKGSVTLRVEELNDYFKFDIIDTGIGIAKNEYGNIFEEFKKINNPEIRNSHGVGLGLAISQHLIALHGGNISFSSEVGKGSTFTFTIPKNYSPNQIKNYRLK